MDNNIATESLICYLKNNIDNNKSKKLEWKDECGNGNDAIISYLDFVDGIASDLSGWTERGLKLNSNSNLDMPYINAKTIEINVNCLNWRLRKVAAIVKVKTKSDLEYSLKAYNWSYIGGYWYANNDITTVSSYSLTDSGIINSNDDNYHSIVLVFHSTNEISCYVDGIFRKKVVEKTVTDINGIKLYNSNKLYSDLAYDSVKFYANELTDDEIKKNYDDYKYSSIPTTEEIIPENIRCYLKSNVENNISKILTWKDKTKYSNNATISSLDFINSTNTTISGWTDRGLQLNANSNLDMPYVKARTVEINVNCLNWSLRKILEILKVKTKSNSEYLLKLFHWSYIGAYWYIDDETTSVSSYALSDYSIIKDNDDDYHSIVLVFHSNNEISCYVDGIFRKKVIEKKVVDIESIKLYSSKILYPNLTYESVKFYEGELTADEISKNYLKYKNGIITEFLTVEDMKVANLTEGLIVTTKGYYKENDGGAAKYKIINKEEYFNELPEDCKYIEVLSGITIKNYGDGYGNHKLNNGLIAKLIIENEITYAEQWGAKGDGITSDTEALICMLALTKSGTINFKANSVYIIAERTVNERSKYIDNRFCLSMVKVFTGGCQKPLIANCNNLKLNGNNCTLKIPDNNFGKDSMGMICLGNVINGLEITGFTFDSNGLTMTDINKTSNHTIVYSPGTINVDNSEISNVNIHHNKFLANGTIVDTKDGGGDHILIINPTISHDVYIEDNEFYDWGRWVYSIDLGGNGERFYNYKFNRNKCIQGENNKLPTGKFRGLGWIDYEAKKCWTNLEVNDNEVSGLVGFAINGNDKTFENIYFCRNTINYIDRDYKSAYPYFINWYYVRNIKNFICENNYLNEPYSIIPSRYSNENIVYRNNIITMGAVLSLYGIYGDIIIDNNTSINSSDLLIISYGFYLPSYIDTSQEKRCNFVFTNNKGGFKGASGKEILFIDPNENDYYSFINFTIENNILNGIKIACFGNSTFKFNPEQFQSNSINFVVKGAKFTKPTIYNPINVPIMGCGIYNAGDLVVKGVKMSRMEIAYVYINYIVPGKVYDIYCASSGYFPQAYSDIYLPTALGRNAVKNSFYYTENSLYMALNDGVLGTTVVSHQSGIQKCGQVDMLYLYNIAKINAQIVQ